MYRDFIEKYNVSRCTVLDYHSLIVSIPRKWRDLIARSNSKLESVNCNKLMGEIMATNKVCKLMYTKFIKKLNYKIKAHDKWEQRLETNAEIDWAKCNKLAKSVTQSAKLVSFQYKILNNILCTNRTLRQCNIKADDLCTFCNINPETISHLLWECRVSKEIWFKTKEWLLPQVNIDEHLCLNSSWSP